MITMITKCNLNKTSTSKRLAEHIFHYMLLAGTANNLPEHNQVDDMRVSVVRQVKGGMATRQREERRIIFQLGTLVPGGLNIDLSSTSTPLHARKL